MVGIINKMAGVHDYQMYQHDGENAKMQIAKFILLTTISLVFYLWYIVKTV